MMSAWRNKWSATAASAWLQCSVGGAYCFGVYSPILKSSQGYSQSTLSSVAFFKDIGANAGILSGLILSHLHRPRLVLMVGSVLCTVGYLLMWASVVGLVPRPPVVAMCAYMLVAAQSQTFFNTANVVTAVENFPESRGTVIGIMKGFLGLSGAILVQIYQTFFNGNQSLFILMLALLPPSLALLLMYFIEVHHTIEGNNKKFLDSFCIISLSIAGYLTILIVSQSLTSIARTLQIIMLSLLLLLLCSPLAVVMKTKMKELESTAQERKSLIDRGNRLDETLSRDTTNSLNLLEAMCTLNFWLLFLSIACGLGSGLATINNISQIGLSLGYSISATNTLVSLWAILNFLGRFTAGYFSDYLMRTKGCTRPLYLALTLLVMSGAHMAISLGFAGSLYVGSTLIGLCYGSQWVLMPSITSEIFGLWHFGTIFNTIAVASPVGSYILSVRVVGYIYDMEAKSGHTCMGKHCFMLSFLIMAGTSLLGFASALALYFQTRSFYEQVVRQRLEETV